MVMEPTKEDIVKWSNALRSGEYKQTKGKLQDLDGHCCLGVACEVFISKSQQLRVPGGGVLTGGFPGNQWKAPAWLKDINRDFEIRTFKELFLLNDKEGLTFDEIADVLEAVYIHEVLS